MSMSNTIERGNIAEWNSIPVTGFQEAIYTNTFVCQNFPDLSEKSLLQHKFSLFKSKVDVNSLRRLYVFPEKSLSIHLKYDVNTFDVIEMEYLLAAMVKDIKRSIKKLSP